MNIPFLFLLFAYWFLVWAVFNSILLPNNLTHLKGGSFIILYFLFVSLIPLLFIEISQFWLLLGLVGLTLLPIFSSFQVIKSLFSNVIFQQLMLYLLFINTFARETIPHLFYFIIGVILSHLPLLFLKHVHSHGKILIHALLPLCGCLIFFLYYLLPPLSALLLGIILHLSFYLTLYHSRLNSRLGIIV